MKDFFKMVNNIPMPQDAKFIDDKRIEVTFKAPFNELDENSSTISFLRTDLPELEEPILSYNDSEGLTTYSFDGKKRAILRQIPYKKTMPSTVPKFKEKVSILEIFQNQQILNRIILNEDYSNFTTHPSISNGLVFSPNDKKLCFTISDKIDLEKESILGYKTKMSEYKDFGEDMSEIYHTSLAVYDIESNSLLKIKAPEQFCVCKPFWASNDIIVIQAVDYSQSKVLGLRSYTNRQFSIFAVNINKPEEIKKIMGPKQSYLDVFGINEKLAKIFTFEFPDDFPGHDGPLYPKTFLLNLENLEVSDIKKSDKEVYVGYPPKKLFLNENEVVFSEEYHGFLFGTVINLKDFSKSSLPGTKCCQVLDIRNNKILILKSTPSSIPQLYLVDGFKEKSLTKNYDFNLEYSHEYIGDISDYCNILIVKAKNSKKFILFPHGGPHGMTNNGYNKRALLFALNGYNVVHINYIGSTGLPPASIKKIFGNCGKADLETLVQAANYIRKKFSPEKLGIWGFSHGGFLSTHMAAKHSGLIDFAVIGAPVTNFVSSFFSCDIPDWALDESGINENWYAEKKLDKESFDKMWDMSPMKYIDGVNVPVLIIHGSIDRRVPIGQSIELYTALRRMGKKVKFYQYDENGHSFKHVSAADDMIAVSLEFFEDPDKVTSQ